MRLRHAAPAALGYAIVKLGKLLGNPIFYQTSDNETHNRLSVARAHQRSLNQAEPAAGVPTVAGVPVAEQAVRRLQAYDAWIPVVDFENRDTKGRFIKVRKGAVGSVSGVAHLYVGP